MAVPNSSVFLAKSKSPPLFPLSTCRMSSSSFEDKFGGVCVGNGRSKLRLVCAVGGNTANNNSNSSDGNKKKGVPNSNYVVPLDKSFSSSYSSCITRPLAEILRDLNKRIPDNIIKPSSPVTTYIPWYHANRMLSFYAPGWCGEIRDVIFSDNGSVTVVYRVTIRGSDGEAYRESTGTVLSSDGNIVDPVAAAEEIAFCRACARFGLGLYLYHEE
ncbi:hypothetical protein JCGZ_23055 [Jatropha curcas]|uniref:DNA repair RAD52-like protein 2, chloroplastic n=1 Tax=Jatropha curcas TaxID=180498 RepID=A0A067JHB6_JATCU|nr:DNA repair RAD52-like protein 2, chloroplastic [Jatropha curcas]KDP23222.1 hypothetical protein JCGZ_23055 [Jatropha curcas]